MDCLDSHFLVTSVDRNLVSVLKEKSPKFYLLKNIF